MTDAQFAALMDRLTEVRNLLAYAVEGPAPSTDAPACAHPEELREDRSTLTRTGFRCQCGYTAIADRRTGEPVPV